MSHKVIDNDTHFLIDAETLEITNETDIKALKCGDHASERFTFTAPRYIEGHDISECDKVEVHYNNAKYDPATRTTTTNKSFDEVEDFALSEDGEKVTFSWLIKGDALQLDGTLAFSVRFACMEGDVIEYQKFTGIFKDIPVGETIYNTEEMAKAYADAFERWKAEILAEMGGGTVKTVNGIEPDENGNVEVTSSWNDLQDKPFGETPSLTLINDEVSFEPGGVWSEGVYKPTTFIPLEIGKTYTVTYGSESFVETYDIVCAVDEDGDMEYGLKFTDTSDYGGGIVLIYNDIDNSQYCIKDSSGGSTPRFVSIVQKGDIKTLDPKYLPNTSGAFVVNVTATTDAEGNTTYSADKTFEEIANAIENGRNVVSTLTQNDATQYYPLIAYAPNSTVGFCLLQYVSDANMLINTIIQIDSEETVLWTVETKSLS